MPVKKEEMGLCTGREDQGTTASLGKTNLQDYLRSALKISVGCWTQTRWVESYLRTSPRVEYGLWGRRKGNSLTAYTRR